MKFQVSPTPGGAGSYMKETSSRDVAVVSRPPCFEPNGSKEEDFGLETEATALAPYLAPQGRFRDNCLNMPQPHLDQWVTSLLHPNQQMKFQVNSFTTTRQRDSAVANGQQLRRGLEQRGHRRGRGMNRSYLIVV